MTAAVLDVNVIVSGFPGRRGAAAIDRWLTREFRIIVSEHILNGVIRAWDNPWFRDRYGRNEVERALYLLRTQASAVTPISGIHGVAPDAEDDLVLGTAVAGEADYLETATAGSERLGNSRPSAGSSHDPAKTAHDSAAVRAILLAVLPSTPRPLAS